MQFIIICILVLLPMLSQAETFKVKDVKEFEAAQKKLMPGDIVEFGPGTFLTQLVTASNGVTYRGTKDYTTRIVRPRSGGSGNQTVTIRHSSVTIERLVIDGELEAGESHGLIRFYSSADIVLAHNRILNSRGTLISVGGSVHGAKIKDVVIRGNHLEGSGVESSKYGEGIYVGSNLSSPGSVKNVRIVGNTIRDTSDNAIDLKGSAESVMIEYNLIEKQVLRTLSGNHGTIVAQGSNHIIQNNIVRNVNGGSSVFNLTQSANIRVEQNVIDQATASRVVRIRANGQTGKTLVQNNQFCRLSTKESNTSTGLKVSGNAGLDQPGVDCKPRMDALMVKVMDYQKTQAVPPAVLLPVAIDRITYADPELGENVVRVYVRSVHNGDPQMENRNFNDAVSVRFEDLDGTEVTYHKDKRSKGEYPAGWSFYLDKPYPAGDIRMIADEGWFSGAPAVDQIVPYKGIVIEATPPMVELSPGIMAICAKPMEIISPYVAFCPKTGGQP